MADRVRFGEFEADLAAGELWRDGTRVRIQDLPFRLLAALIERPGELVTRTELGDRLWGGDTFVDFEAGLNTAMAKLREALGDSAATPRVIETVPKRGYRLVTAVSAAPDPRPASATPPLEPWPVKPTARSAGARELRLALLVGVLPLAALIAVAMLAGAATYFWRKAPPMRVAVVLFDNETGREDFDRLAQMLTDSAVLKLGADRRFDVIGNAAVLRTDRPFRDLKTIRQAVAADVILIGQIQQKAEGYRVMTHLIRAADEAHVWVKETLFATGSEPALERDVVDAIDQALVALSTKSGS